MSKTNAIAAAARHAHRRIIAGAEQPMDMAIIEARTVQKYGKLAEPTAAAYRAHRDLPMAAGMWRDDAKERQERRCIACDHGLAAKAPKKTA